MEYFVANSYKNYEYNTEDSYIRNNKLYVLAKCACDRCLNGVYITRVENGVPVPHPNYGGVCLKCGGKGYVSKEIRLYTEKEKAAMDKAAARAQEKKKQEAENRIIQNELNSEKNKKIWFEKMHFTQDGYFYTVSGNTYPIKNLLKENGYRYDSVLGWYNNTEIDLPEGYSNICVHYESVYSWDAQAKIGRYKTGAVDIMKFITSPYIESKSQYIGEINDKFMMKVVFTGSFGFEGRFGWTNVLNFKQGDNEIKWFTAKNCDLSIGDEITLSGTIKAHEEYKNIKSTIVTRCKIME